MASSIRKIAEATGLSTATVSDALRGTGRVAPATRERVMEAARSMGYQPDPLVTKAMALARRPYADRYRETIAVLTQFPKERRLTYQIDLLDAVRARAERLGYKVEDFVCTARSADHRRLSRILVARGIRGVIILPRLLSRFSNLQLDWDRFATLEIGRTIRRPFSIHRVERSIYYELICAFHMLKKAGFRRIGLAISPREDSSRWGIYTAAYLMYQQQIAHSIRIPSLASYGPWQESTLAAWMQEHRPDVLVIQEYHWVCDWLENCGYRWPDNISLFCTNNRDTDLTGFHADMVALGKGAADMMSVLLENNETGLPPQPRSLLINDIWEESKSLKYPLPQGIASFGDFHGKLNR